MSKNLARVLRALARRGLSVVRDGPVYHVRSSQHPGAPTAHVLLPSGFDLDGKALGQLTALAAVTHPAGGAVERVHASPDFHAGSLVPVGAIIATSPDLVIPQAIGTDIQCGMRLHLLDLELGEFEARRKAWVELLTGDLLLGTRDLPLSVASMRALFAHGSLGLFDELRRERLGMLARADLNQLEHELERSLDLGSFPGDLAHAPLDLMPRDRSVVRDCFLGTIGGGNHFVELQVVDHVFERSVAYHWGVRAGQLALMVHSGSRRVGAFVGTEWLTRAREVWPGSVGRDDYFPLQGEHARHYLGAMHLAANYGSVNRMLLAEIARDRTRQVFGRDVEMPLLFDAPHNTIRSEGGSLIHRKGATPAHLGDPVLIPGSMGHPSFLLVGQGNDSFLCSASHGAGRAFTRTQMHAKQKRGDDLGLGGVECITLKRERLVQEAPAAYKAIEPVVQIQCDVGIAQPVARFRPVLTFKG